MPFSLKQAVSDVTGSTRFHSWLVSPITISVLITLIIMVIASFLLAEADWELVKFGMYSFVGVLGAVCLHDRAIKQEYEKVSGAHQLDTVTTPNPLKDAFRDSGPAAVPRVEEDFNLPGLNI